MKEYPIDGAVRLRVVPNDQDTCTGCFFDELQRRITDINYCTEIKCRHYERKDGKDVMFVLEDEERSTK